MSPPLIEVDDLSRTFVVRRKTGRFRGVATRCSRCGT